MFHSEAGFLSEQRTVKCHHSCLCGYQYLQILRAPIPRLIQPGPLESPQSTPALFLQQFLLLSVLSGFFSPEGGDDRNVLRYFRHFPNHPFTEETSVQNFPVFPSKFAFRLICPWVQAGNGLRVEEFKRLGRVVVRCVSGPGKFLLGSVRAGGEQAHTVPFVY